MPPRATANKQNETKRSILVVPSKIYSAADKLEGAEETEIAAQISVPEEGGWGWVVVIASFMAILLLDGIYFTFGSILHDIRNDMNIDESLVALMNSLAVALYFLGGPLVSALINRFGFRACTMSGSILCAIALLCSYFAISFVTLLICYSILGGFGASLVSMSSGLVVGFYFERLRSLAMALASIGSSVGISIMFSVNSTLVSLAGWRVTTLFHSGLAGLIYFLGMAYRPLLSLTVTKTTEDPSTRTVTYLPSLAVIKSPSHTRREGLMPSAAERLFSAVSNSHFPTAATVIEEGVPPEQQNQPTSNQPTTNQPTSTQPTSTQPGPSSAGVSRLTLTANAPQSGITRRQLKQVQSIISRTSVQPQDKDKTIVERNVEHSGERSGQRSGERNIELTINIPEVQKRKWWQRLCHWEEHVAQSRPMYRDDAFYEGRLDQLPAYQKSMMDTAVEGRTGLEYQMAVSRAVTAADLSEKRGVFTTAVRRVLATMMDPKLLKTCSFLLLCTSAFFTYLGYLVPFVFLSDRNKIEGIAPSHCSLFVPVMGGANAVGRLVIGALACKFDPLKLYWIACIVSGFSIIAFNFSFHVYYQYAVCVVFGFHIASLSSIRSMVLVQLYGLDKLTNATGMMIMFQGIGSLIGTPASSIIKTHFGYYISFIVAGVFVLFSGLILLPVKKLNDKEKKKNAAKKEEQTAPSKRPGNSSQLKTIVNNSDKK